MLIIELKTILSLQCLHFEMPQEQTIIGPLVFKKNVPNLVLTRARFDLDRLFGYLNRSRVTELTLTHGRLNAQLDKIEEIKEWIEKYEFVNLVTLNCSHNEIPNLSRLTVFQLPRLQTLNLSDCNIEDLEGISRCDFEQLSSLKLFNNHLVSLRGFRKLKVPFLSELVMDSNHLIELKGTSEINLMFLTSLELHNNQLVTVRPLMKVNFPRINDLRLENRDTCIDTEWSYLAENVAFKKFIQLN